MLKLRLASKRLSVALQKVEGPGGYMVISKQLGRFPLPRDLSVEIWNCIVREWPSRRILERPNQPNQFLELTSNNCRDRSA